MTRTPTAAPNRFRTGTGDILVYGIEDTNPSGKVSCVDVAEGFIFEMTPDQLRDYLERFSHGFVPEASR